MKIEKLRNSKKYFLCGLILVVVLMVTITFITSKAEYRMTASIPLNEGKVTASPYDIKVIAMYVNNGDGNYQELNDEVFMPDASLYNINEEKSFCYKTKSTEHDDNIRLYTENGNHVIKNLSKKDKCTIFFDKKVARTMSEILDDYYIYKKIRKSGTFNQVISGETSKVIYIGEDDDGITYYFAGNPTDNWFKFGDYYWRIIRINGDGSIRMIYHGSTPAKTGNTTHIGGTSFNITNSDSAYIGLMYGETGLKSTDVNAYERAHANTNKSVILQLLYDWFKNTSGLNSEQYFDKIDKNAGFCGDRTPSTDKTFVNNEGGISPAYTYYGAYIRLKFNDKTSELISPSFKCPNKANDLYTYKGASQGNSVLEYPIGLITLDEVAYAGLHYSMSAVQNNYLTVNQHYWTMTPLYSEWAAWLGYVNWTGYYDNSDAGSSNRVRPVINIRSDVKLSGNGTQSNPYVIS
ncbi:MAG: hypothetical protein NC483_00770 [Ruminococcus sp.]|nr:hypothetical protein [Ruminococcus sp.]